MKIVFDSGVLISFSETCNLSLFKSLKDSIGEFIITQSVKYECIGKVENIMRFKLSSIRIEREITDNIFTVIPSSTKLLENTTKLLDLANNMFYVRHQPIKIIQGGEAECLALLGLTDADCLAVDERTTRMLVEQPHALIDIFKRKYDTGDVRIDEDKYVKFRELIGPVSVLRSVDLFAYAHKHDLLGADFQSPENVKAALYSLKIKGCSVSFQEIDEYISSLYK
jgi:hypothetical protein